MAVLGSPLVLELGLGVLILLVFFAGLFHRSDDRRSVGVVAVVSLGVFRVHPTRAVAANQEIPVQFVLVAPGAHSVAVVGDFNNWGLNDTALVAENHNGVWSVSASVHTGVHRYAFLVNGKEWVADPTAPRAADDDFGQPSSALVVEASTQ